MKHICKPRAVLRAGMQWTIQLFPSSPAQPVTWFHLPRAWAPKVTMLLTHSYWHPHTSKGCTSTLTISNSTPAQHCWRISPIAEGFHFPGEKGASIQRWPPGSGLALKPVSKPFFTDSSPSLVNSFQISQDLTTSPPAALTTSSLFRQCSHLL